MPLISEVQKEIRKGNMKEWTQQEIKDLLNRSNKAVVKGIIAIYKQQTIDEQAIHTTTIKNGRGFNGLDAEFGSSLAEKALEYGTLTDKQMVYARKMTLRYSKQLTLIANGLL